MSHSTQIRHQLARILTVGLLAVMATACATTGSESPAPMMLGAQTTAPLGLLRMCASGALDCPTPDPSGDLTLTQATGGAGVDERPHMSQAKSSPRPAAAPATPDTQRVDHARFAEIVSVNREINSRLTWRSDQDVYGQEEYWAMPIAVGLRYGDCEDFALEKRRELLERGFPPASLALATGYSQATGLHAVLIVRTTQGDFVLDNTTPWVVPWQQTPYRWERVQSGEDLTQWRQVIAS